MKILAIYLPQFHRVKENDLWWGEGYTEWTSVKRAQPLMKNHYQPKVPLNRLYYDLVDESAETWKWQSELANKYGIYGFGIYHYWFKGKQLLEKPMEILLKHKEININYCIIWANESWTRTWYGLENEVLMSQEYGTITNWKAHFEYLLPFFIDERYIKINNKPMVNFYRSSDIDCLSEMIMCWNELAKKNGFDGIYVVSANTGGKLEEREGLIDARYNFEPGYTLNHVLPKFYRYGINAKTLIRGLYNKFSSSKIVERIIDARLINKFMNKNKVNSNKPVYKGAFTMWDNTPRRDHKGLVYTNTTPKLFEKALLKIKETSTDDEFVYINAWNEWGEGCYLEPDEVNKYDYLEIIKRIKSN
ncbi:MAG: glycoside hydrolase family 99-like domain-containing protein [Sedimentibacter saalensis]|uniref:glycosyltransferase WbsX family protein n=1 Tax=Sedimentibacter saalensis TaxID=130788 RepID=UPI00315899E7